MSKKNAEHTQFDAPLAIVPILMPHAVHLEVPGVDANCPAAHTKHSVIPDDENVPG
jgi:hypothetical protein